MSAKTEKKARASDNGARDEQPPAKVERTKAPPLAVYADDLTTEVDGVDYHPHAGEVVRFTGGMSVGDVKMVVDLSEFQNMQMGGADLTDEQRDKLKDFTAKLDEAADFMAARIVSWTWTNDREEPYEDPPTAKLLRALPFSELMWLLTAGFKAARGDDARLKGSQP